MSAVVHATSDVAHLPAARPTMSHTLQKWLEERALTPRGVSPKPLSDAIPDDQQIDALVEEYSHLEQGGMAVKVMQGFILLQASTLGNDSFRQLTSRCDVPLTTAQRSIELYQLFNLIGDLKLLSKAEQLGVRRICELKVYFGIDGLRQLIEGATLAGLKYSTIESLPSREIALWVRQRKAEENAERLAAQAARDGIHATGTGYVEEPRALVVARDELVATMLRVRAEIDIAFEELHLLGDDLPEPARSELLHFVAHEAKGIAALLQQLRTACANATDRRVNDPLPELDTLPNKLLDDASTFAANAAELDLAKRASARQKRHGWKGRPPASLESVLAHALKADSQDDQGE